MKRYVFILLQIVFVAFNAVAQDWHDLAYSYVDKGEYSEAIKIYNLHKNELSKNQENTLAFCYEELNDYTNAINWYKKAANHGSSRAQFNLGRIYDRRYGTHSGVVSNDELAKKYYLDAIYNTSEEAKGRGWAVYNLWIVLQDENKIEEAKPILEFSVKNKVNLTEAPYLLAKVFYKDSEESLYYYRISAENGDERAQYELANMFASGKYIEKDLKEAGFWYRKAADQNHFGAQEEIGKCYEELYIKTLDNRYLELCLKYYYKIYTDDNDSGAPRIISLSNVSFDENGNMTASADNPLETIYKKGLYHAEEYSTYDDWLKNKVKPLSLDSDVDINIPKTQIKSKSIAVIVANENYKFEHYVPYAENDGEVISKYFEYTLGISNQNIHLIKDASLNTMKREVEWLIENSHDVDNIYFYYTGHGIPANDLSTSYLLPVDGYAKDPETGLNIQWLYSKLASTNVKSIVLLDACFSGSGRHQNMLVEARGVAIKPKDIMPQNNTIVISACQGVEMAYPYEEQKHGLFTYCFLKSLQTTNGKVCLGDVYDYIQENVSAISKRDNGKIQTPSVMVSSDLSEIWRNVKLR